jgi:hypothetical protein
VVFFRKIRGDCDIQDNFFYKDLSLICFAVFKTLCERDVISGNLALLTETEDIDSGTGTNRCKEIIKGSWR